MSRVFQRSGFHPIKKRRFVAFSQGSNPRNDDESGGKTIHLRHHTGAGGWGWKVGVDRYT